MVAKRMENPFLSGYRATSGNNRRRERLLVSGRRECDDDEGSKWVPPPPPPLAREESHGSDLRIEPEGLWREWRGKLD